MLTLYLRQTAFPSRSLFFLTCRVTVPLPALFCYTEQAKSVESGRGWSQRACKSSRGAAEWRPTQFWFRLELSVGQPIGWHLAGHYIGQKCHTELFGDFRKFQETKEKFLFFQSVQLGLRKPVLLVPARQNAYSLFLLPNCMYFFWEFCISKDVFV